MYNIFNCFFFGYIKTTVRQIKKNCFSSLLFSYNIQVSDKALIEKATTSEKFVIQLNRKIARAKHVELTRMAQKCNEKSISGPTKKELRLKPSVLVQILKKMSPLNY